MDNNEANNNQGLQDERDAEMCAIALDEAFSLCGNNVVIFEQIAGLMGIRKADLNSVTPLNDKYQGILNAARYDDKWVIARAWDLVANDGLGIMDAFRQAWEEVDASKGGSQASPDGAAPVSEDLGDEPDIDQFPEA